MIYVPPNYDDELTPDMQHMRDQFREVLNLVLAKFRGETRKAIIAAMLNVLDAAAKAGDLCDAACEELKMEFQFRFHDAAKGDGDSSVGSEPNA